MASRKCSKCGKPVARLYDGICTACRSMQAYETGKKQEDNAYKTEFHNEDERAFSGFINLMAKEIDDDKKDEAEYDKYLSMSPEEQRKWEYNRICELNFIDKATQLKYRPQLLQIMKKYRGLLLDEDVYLCTKEEYAKTGGGEVCDIIGNFVIRRFVDKKDTSPEIKTTVLLDADLLVEFLEGSD